MKSFSKIKSTIDKINHSRKRVNQVGEIQAKMNDLHENKDGYPKSRSSFYIIYNNKCSRILYVDKKEILRNVLQLFIEYEVEYYFYRFENRILNGNSLYFNNSKNGREINYKYFVDEEIDTLINGCILNNNFYIIIYSKEDKNEETKINYYELDKRLNECISKKINPLDKIKFLTSFENAVPNINYLVLKILYTIGCFMTLELKL